MAAGLSSSVFVAEGGRHVSCGDEQENEPGVLGHGELEGEDRMVQTPTLLPCRAGIRISSVSVCLGFGAAILAAGKIYTWGKGVHGYLGHVEDGTVFSWGRNDQCQLWLLGLAAAVPWQQQASSSCGATDSLDGSGTATQRISMRQGALRPSKVSGWLRCPRALCTPSRSRAVAACLAGAEQTRLACQTPLPFLRTYMGTFAFRLLASSPRR